MPVTWESLINRQESQKIYLAELELARYNDLNELETKTLYLSTQPINPIHTDKYYEPRLQGVSNFNRRIQEIFYGNTQVSYGDLSILIGDGGLLSDIQDWNWAGRQIIIKLGFSELNITDYRTIFTGRMGQPRYTSNLLTVPIQDYQKDSLRKYYPSGTYNDTLPNLIQLGLDTIGVEKDTALWDTWVAENNFNVFLKTEGEAVSTVFDRLLTNLCCWWGFDREGKFQVATFKSPTDADTPILSLSQIEILRCDVEYLDKLYWKVGVRYYTDTSVDPPTTASVTREDSTIETLNPLSFEGDEKETCLTSETDAQTILDRWWDILSVQRRKVNITAKVQPFMLKLGSVVNVDYPKSGLSGNFRVVGFNENYINSQVAMELFA